MSLNVGTQARLLSHIFVPSFFTLCARCQDLLMCSSLRGSGLAIAQQEAYNGTLLPPIANNVKDSITPPGSPPIGCYDGSSNNSFRIICINVQDGSARQFCHIGGMDARAPLHGRSCEAQLIIHHQMQCAADRVTCILGGNRGCEQMCYSCRACNAQLYGFFQIA